MTTLSQPCSKHEPSSTLNTVALMPYLKEISSHSLTTFALSQLCPTHTSASRLNTWNSAIQQISDWFNMAGTYRSIKILNSNFHMAFFISDYFGEMNTRVNEHLLAQFTLALEIGFESALQFHNEGYESDGNHDLPKPLIRST